MIKNIIFDLGGVLLNIDYTRTVSAFKALGLGNPEAHFTKEIQSSLFQKYERGQISDIEFLEALKKHMPKATLVDLENAWCALLGDFPLDRIDLLEALSKKYRLFVLSNTNHIHQVKFEQIIDRACGWTRFESIFEYIGYSHRMHERKPDDQIFLKLLGLNKLKARESFFVDDTMEHVLAADRLGLQTHHLLSHEDIHEVFADW